MKEPLLDPKNLLIQQEKQRIILINSQRYTDIEETGGIYPLRVLKDNADLFNFSVSTTREERIQGPFNNCWKSLYLWRRHSHFNFSNIYHLF